MRSLLTLALVATLAAPAAAQQRDTLTADERRRLVTRLEQLQTELAELQARLGRTNRVLLRAQVGEPFVWRVGTSNRARLGVIVNTDPSADDRQGARLTGITPNGPAAQAGLLAGDIIVRVNGVSLANARPNPGQRLIEEVDDLDDGDTVRVEYRRGDRNERAVVVARTTDAFSFGGRPLMLSWDSLRAGARFQFDSAGFAGGRLFDSAGVLWRGLLLDSARGALNRALVEVREMPGLRMSLFTNRWSSIELTTLDAGLGSYFGTTEGLLVVRAPSDSLLGLRSGDVILRIGGRVPTSPSHALRILRSYEPGDRVELDVMRERRSQRLNALIPRN